ncbi:MAG: hypothetical protein ABI682_02655 [Acidobacteriota bacterium]
MKKETDGVSEEVFPGKTAASLSPESERLHPEGWDRRTFLGVSLGGLHGPGWAAAGARALPASVAARPVSASGAAARSWAGSRWGSGWR